MSGEKREVRQFQLQEHRGAYVWDLAETDDLPGFRCRHDDVWVCSFPRSGTTLTQQMVYLIMTLDSQRAVTVDLDDRFPFADILPARSYLYRGLKHIDSMPKSEPRLIKSHFHHFLLPDQLRQGKGKIVYITRNPKASVVSWYNLLKFLNLPHTPTLDEYVERFLTQKDDLSRSLPTFQDRRVTIKKIADFLGRDLTEEQVDKIMDYTSLESMKNSKTCNFVHIETELKTDKSQCAFINKGEVSGWRKDLSDDLIQKTDDLIKTEMKDTDIVYE